MENILNTATEITSQEYMDLKNPIFKGQTRLDVSNQYWMIFENDGIFYKIHNTL